MTHAFTQALNPDFMKYEGKGCLYTHFKLFGAIMAQYNDDDIRSLIGPVLLWFTKVELLRITMGGLGPNIPSPIHIQY